MNKSSHPYPLIINAYTSADTLLSSAVYFVLCLGQHYHLELALLSILLMELDQFKHRTLNDAFMYTVHLSVHHPLMMNKLLY